MLVLCTPAFTFPDHSLPAPLRVARWGKTQENASGRALSWVPASLTPLSPPKVPSGGSWRTMLSLPSRLRQDFPDSTCCLRFQYKRSFDVKFDTYGWRRKAWRPCERDNVRAMGADTANQGITTPPLPPFLLLPSFPKCNLSSLPLATARTESDS